MADQRIRLGWVCASLLVAASLWRAEPASAQTKYESGVAGEPKTASEDQDAAAREHFVLGRAAYRGADYREALEHFRRAYELSHRSQLQYNIAISADRLGQDEDALAAFEGYLEENQDAPRAQEVRERITFLRLAIERSKEEERARAEEAGTQSLRLDDTPPRRMSKSAIAGGSALGAVGAAGVTMMALGLSQNGKCLERDALGACTTERTASPWTIVYGGVGLAALAGSATWFAIGSRRAKRERASTWMLSPTGIVVSGSF